MSNNGCNYYFSESKIRPFAGLGVGAYHVLYHSPKLNTGIKPLIGLNIYDYSIHNVFQNRTFLYERITLMHRDVFLYLWRVIDIQNEKK